MAELLKIREVSSRYDISARALRYYEDMGLIKSTRSAEYAYRLYDQQAVKRLEQILILRKLNISIKDIQLIFQSAGTEILLEVLEKKTKDIDDEVALLSDLKNIILEFIGQIRQADFGRDADVKRLYEKQQQSKTTLQIFLMTGTHHQSIVYWMLRTSSRKRPKYGLSRSIPFGRFRPARIRSKTFWALFSSGRRRTIILSGK